MALNQLSPRLQRMNRTMDFSLWHKLLELTSSIKETWIRPDHQVPGSVDTFKALQDEFYRSIESLPSRFIPAKDTGEAELLCEAYKLENPASKTIFMQKKYQESGDIWVFDNSTEEGVLQKVREMIGLHQVMGS